MTALTKIANPSSSRLVRQLFLRLLPVQIMTLLVSAINNLIDGLITSRLLGSDAMAVVGLFVPVLEMLNVANMLITGAQIICSNLMGKGDMKKLTSVFSTCMVTLFGFGLIITAAGLSLSGPLAGLLGASGELKGMLSEYIRGYAIGVVFQMLYMNMMSFLPLNNKAALSYVSIGTMITVNLSMDVLFTGVLDMGLFGLGLATSLSYIASSLIVIFSFRNKKNPVHLNFKNLDFRIIGPAMRIGLPGLMFNVSVTVKSYALNTIMLASGSIAAVAALSVQNTMCCLLGVIPCGAAGAIGILGSIFYGEEDRLSLEMLIKNALRITCFIALAVMAALILGRDLVAGLYYVPGSEAWTLTREMLLMFPSFVLFNAVFAILQKTYQCEGRMLFVNVMTAVENLLVAGIAAVAYMIIGVKAVWITYTLTSISCLIIVGISVFIREKRITFSLKDWMKLDKDFGVDEEDRIDITLTSIDGVVDASRRAVEFCRSKNIDERRAMLAGLSLEELAGNIIQHGFTDGKRHSVDVRLVYKNGEITIRFRDNCKAFDPVKYLKQFQPSDPYGNIGLRMIVNMAKRVFYLNNIGMNTLLIKV